MKSFTFNLASFIYQLIRGKPLQKSEAYNTEKLEIIINTITQNLILTGILLLIAVYVFRKKRAWFTKIILLLTFTELFLFSKGNIITMPFDLLKGSNVAAQWLSTNINFNRYLSTSGNFAYTGLGVYWTHLRAREPFSPNKLYEKELKDFDRFKNELKALGENQGIQKRITDVSGYAAVVPREYITYFQKDASSPNAIEIDSLLDEKLDILGVKYIVTGYPQDYLSRSAEDKFKLIFESGDLYIYQNLNAWPRAFLIEDEKPISVEISKYEPNRVVINTNHMRKLPLILTDNYYPGWIASIDGKRIKLDRYPRTPIRMIQVPAGEHQVEFVYKPRSIQIGAIISAVGILAIILGAKWRERQKLLSLFSATTGKKTRSSV